MLNIHELERRWIKYKIKSILPLVLSIFGTLSVVILLVSYLPFSDVKNVKDKQVTNVLKPNIEEKSTIPSQEYKEEVPGTSVVEAIAVPQNTQIQNSTTDKSTLVLKPSLHFMDKIEDGLSHYIQDENYPVEQSRPTQNNRLEYQSEQVAIEQSDETSQVEEKKLTLSISSKKSDEDLKDVIRRFKKNKNPALSLFIAKHYYKSGEYQKSYNYALMTNEIDKSIDESWIIFSKSLVKLGQHELAMNTLKSYLKTNKSSAAEVLLRKIESGSFK